jgi:sulfite exporter TauE/SafE/copper chaperone CopZ
MTTEAKSPKTANIRVAGMYCRGCEDTVRAKLRAAEGVSGVTVSFNKGMVAVTYAPDKITFDGLCALINGLGYETLGEYVAEQFPRTDWKRAAGMIIIIAAVYIVVQQFGLLSRLVPPELAGFDVSYGLIFFFGLATSVHCIAMCGGINLSLCLSAGGGANAAVVTGKNRDDAGKPGKTGDKATSGAVGTDKKNAGGRFSFLWPSLQYNAGRVVSYTLIGGIVGAVGSAIEFSQNMNGVLKLVAGVFMIAMGVAMLDIFPQVRRFVPKMPSFVSRWVGAGATNRGPLVVGLLNGFLPCGPLWTMQGFALSTGNAVKGALAMAVFSMGTAPLMFGLGTFGSFAGRKASRRVMTAGAVAVTVLGIWVLAQSWSLFGLGLSGGMPLAAVTAPQDSASASDKFGIINKGHLLVNSVLLPYAYPSITVEAGRQVRWEIDAPPQNINGCNNRMFIREYGIEHTFKPGKNVIEFTPVKTGKVPYTCWMGMIPGMITVVAEGTGATSTQQQGQSQGRPGGGKSSCCATRQGVQTK